MDIPSIWLRLFPIALRKSLIRDIRRQEKHNGVQITRPFTGARWHNAVFRLENYYSYDLSSFCCARHLKKDYNAVFTNQSPAAIRVCCVLIEMKFRLSRSTVPIAVRKSCTRQYLAIGKFNAYILERLIRPKRWLFCLNNCLNNIIFISTALERRDKQSKLLMEKIFLKLFMKVFLAMLSIRSLSEQVKLV